MSTQSSPTHGGVSRRTLAKGAAWSVPAVTLAAAAPALAASPIVTCQDIRITARCQAISGKDVEVTYEVCTTNGQPLPVGTVLHFSTGGFSLSGWHFGGSLAESSTRSGGTFTVTAPAPCHTLVVRPNPSPLNLGVACLTLAVTELPSGKDGAEHCEGVCASKFVKFKTLGGVGVSVCG